MSTELQSRIQALAERLAEYESTVADATSLLGHCGGEPVDLRDALGQIERLLAGHDIDRTDLAGLAEEIRQAIYEHDRALLLQLQTQRQCLRRTCERDIAQAQVARLAQDSSAASLALDMVMHALAHGDTAAATWLLRYVGDRLSQLDLTLLLVVIRTTWVERSVLPNWAATRDAIAAELRRRGNDPAAMLGGLGEAGDSCDG